MKVKLSKWFKGAPQLFGMMLSVGMFVGLIAGPIGILALRHGWPRTYMNSIIYVTILASISTYISCIILGLVQLTSAHKGRAKTIGLTLLAISLVGLFVQIVRLKPDILWLLHSLVFGTLSLLPLYGRVAWKESVRVPRAHRIGCGLFIAGMLLLAILTLLTDYNAPLMIMTAYILVYLGGQLIYIFPKSPYPEIDEKEGS